MSSPKYRRQERETVILYNEAEENATVCTFNRKLKKKLEKMAARYPDRILLKEISAGGNCVTYTLPKSCVTIYPPHTDEWKDTMRKRATSAEKE